MTQDPVVVVSATARSWAAALRGHAADHGGVVIRATVLMPEDALAEQCQVVLVDDVTSFLTPTFVASVQARGRAVLGLYDPSDSQGKSDLIDVGVDAVAPADIDPRDLVRQIAGLALRGPEDRPTPREVPPARPTGSARTIGVTGPGGGVGVTEVAIELAAALGTADIPTTLVDADEAAPSHAQRLGLPVHPNIHTALHATSQARPLDRCLHPLSTRRALHALPGMAVAEDWGAVPAGTPTRLLAGLAQRARAVVLDLGRCTPRVDGPTGLRFGHAMALAAHSDDLVVVSAPTPTAVTRTLGMVARLHDLPGRLHLVLNRVGPDKYVRDEAIAELRRGTGAALVHVIVEDPRVGRAAWQGTRVTRGRFTSQVGAVAAALGVR